MAIQPFDIVDALQLRVMLPQHAATVASWVRSAGEARNLAPRAAQPISAQTILSWAAPDSNQFLLVPAVDQQRARSFPGESIRDRRAIFGYGELNELDSARQSYWLGHLIIDPSHRGVGYGLRLTRLLLARAFELCGARRVTLVVFPENLPAVACYKRAGFEPDGFENHCDVDGIPIRLLRMAVER